MITGLKTLSSKLPCEPANPDRGSGAVDLHAHHGHGFALRGIHLARHDRRPGLVFRNGEFSQAAARSRSQPADVIRNLHQRSGQRFQRALGKDDFVVRRKRGELVGMGAEGKPVSSAIFLAARSANSGCAFSPVPTAVPPMARS